MRKPEQVIDSAIGKLKKHGKGIILMHDFQRPTAQARCRNSRVEPVSKRPLLRSNVA
jgi:hypothetical protein